jgi:ATP phosphoribosyltransferase regulatory subunit
LLDEAGFAGERRQVLARALDRKDAAAVAEHGGAIAGLLGDLLLAAGPAGPALAALERACLPEAVRALAGRLAEVIGLLQAQAPQVRLTVDPLEFRGYRYHTGVAVTVFAPGRHEELARGGRYLCGEREPATGLTLYADAVLRAAPARAERRVVFVAVGSEAADVRALREKGYVTVMALEQCDCVLEAKRLGCGYVFADGGLGTLSPAGPGQSPGLPL